MNVERCFPKPRYKPFLTGPRRSALWVVLFVLGVVLVVVGVMELTGYDPFSDQREGDTKTVEQLAYKCPICGDWCDHLYVDNRGKRNPTEAVTADARVEGPPIGCYRCLVPKVMAAGGGSVS